MINRVLFLSLLVVICQGEAAGKARPQDRSSLKAPPQATRVVLGDSASEDDEEVKKAISSPVGVSLGIGLSSPHGHLPLDIRPPVLPIRPPGGRPVLISNQRPECAIDENYCLYNQLYPLDSVNSIIDRYYNDVRHLYSDLYQFPPSDIIYYDNRTHDYRRSGHFVCESTVQYLRPGWAQNLHGEWVAVINTDKFPQSIRIESCKYKDKRCEYLPPCYKSRCIQRYNYVKLLCLDPYRPTYRPTVDVFQVPSACSCFVEDFTYY